MRLALRTLGSIAAISAWASIASADDLDHPTILADQPLAVGATTKGQTSKRVGFPAHVYTAGKDGFVKVVMTTSNVDPRANGGIAYRPYMRIYSQANEQRSGEAWSSNGYRNGPTATAELVIRVRKGDRFTVVASLGEHVETANRVNVDYTLIVKE